jgi:hypothetical protein
VRASVDGNGPNERPPVASWLPIAGMLAAVGCGLGWFLLIFAGDRAEVETWTPWAHSAGSASPTLRQAEAEAAYADELEAGSSLQTDGTGLSVILLATGRATGEAIA